MPLLAPTAAATGAAGAALTSMGGIGGTLGGAALTGSSAAMSAAATKGLMAKMMVAQTGLQVKQGLDAKKAAKRGRIEGEAQSISAFDRSAQKGPRIQTAKRKKPGRRGLYV